MLKNVKISPFFLNILLSCFLVLSLHHQTTTKKDKTMKTSNIKITNADRANIFKAAWDTFKNDPYVDTFGWALSDAWSDFKEAREDARKEEMVEDAAVKMHEMDAKTLAKAIGGKVWEKHGMVRVYIQGVGKRFFDFKNGEWDACDQSIAYGGVAGLNARSESEDQMMRIAADQVAAYINA